MAKASAQFTIIDYNDGVSLITGIDANLPLTSLYDPSSKTLNPSWAGGTSLQLTPICSKAGAGGATSIISSLTNFVWQRRIAGGEYVNVISGSNGEAINGTTKVLTVNSDKLTGDVNQVEYRFTANYLDPVLNITVPAEGKICFSRVQNGTSFAVCRAYAVNGTQFRNSSDPDSITIKAELIRGAAHDETDVTYNWSKSTNGTAWTSLSSQSGAGSTYANLVVTPSMVEGGFTIFRCTAKDTDANSNTYNSEFVSEGIAITDFSDPYIAEIVSTSGNVIKNGVGESILWARVRQNGTEVDSTGESLTYTWTKTDKNGNAASFSPVGVEYGSIVATNKKAIKVNAEDVDDKATFFVEVN